MNKKILDKIVEKKMERLAGKKEEFPLTLVKERLGEVRSVSRDFKKAISKDSIALIAELKKASPSAGVLRRDFDPVAIAKECEEGGADAVSVLTEEDFFKGSADTVSKVRAVTSRPVLAKDFFIDEYQIYEAKLAGADCILLIVRLLDREDILRFMGIAAELGLSCLVEVHDERELEKAIACDARIIGINNRNLDTFQVDIKTTERLRKLIPDGGVVVSESGISKRDDVRYLSSLGINAILVGEVLMRSKDITRKIGELLGNSSL